MIKVSKLSDYATVLMTVVAQSDGQLLSAHDLHEKTRIPEPTVSKVLKLLSKAKLLDAHRGAHGGYALARSSIEITVAHIVTAIEGPIGLTECSIHDECCTIEPWCGVRGNWRLISAAVNNALQSVSLQQMATTALPAQKRHEQTLAFNAGHAGA